VYTFLTSLTCAACLPPLSVASFIPKNPYMSKAVCYIIQHAGFLLWEVLALAQLPSWRTIPCQCSTTVPICSLFRYN
jgi:hypothetical protein